ncbi:MAG: CBS domain-containing protein [Candidatus Omnitrophota bacterium]|jgi:CBS domain-containing protein|nr:MAG: CBS domain-containing protein [Candidatus Omnitrophota bacterium]
MNSKCVKDLMLPISEYPVVSINATLLDAIKALEESQIKCPPDLEPFRAVLVKDEENRIVGKIGQLAFLKALDPQFSLTKRYTQTLFQAGVAPEMLDSMIENLRFWQDDLDLLCRRGRSTLVKDVMALIEDSIDENDSLSEAVRRIVKLQTLSILVTRKSAVVGILRLSDLYREIAAMMKEMSNE